MHIPKIDGSDIAAFHFYGLALHYIQADRVISVLRERVYSIMNVNIKLEMMECL